MFCSQKVRNPLRLPRETSSERPKVVRTWCALYILTWKCASRHNGVHFFDISTIKISVGIHYCVHRPQNNCVTLEMIEGTVLCPQDFGVSFIQFFFVFLSLFFLKLFSIFCLIVLK